MSLELQHITFGYTQDYHLFDDLSAEFKPGCAYVLMGPNGCGKTTLFNLITGFLNPYHGRIFFNGQQISKISPTHIARKGLRRSFQKSRFPKALTVKENILLCISGNQALSVQDHIESVAAYFFLKDKLNIRAGDLSFGQQKLLSLACCYAADASCFLLDEPVAGVQPGYADQIAARIGALKEEGKVVIIIEHNTNFITQVADQILFLQPDRLVPFENIHAMKTNQLIYDAYYKFI